MKQQIPPTNCLNCKHGTFDIVAKNIMCNHPQRPHGKTLVVQWFPGCPQYEPQDGQKEEKHE